MAGPATVTVALPAMIAAAVTMGSTAGAIHNLSDSMTHSLTANHSWSANVGEVGGLLNLTEEEVGIDGHVQVADRLLKSLGNLLGALAVLLNLLVVLSVSVIRRGCGGHDKASAAYYNYILSLAAADIFAAVSFLVTQHWPHWSFYLVHPDENYYVAHGLGYLLRSLPWLFFTAYILTLACVAWSQYVAVVRPWQYAALVSPGVVRGSLAAVWCVAALQIAVPLATFLVLLGAVPDADAAYSVLYSFSYYETHAWLALYVLTLLTNLVLQVTTYTRLGRLKKQQTISKDSSASSLRTSERVSMASKQEAFVTLTALLLAAVTCRLPFPIVAIVSQNIDHTNGMTVVTMVDALVIFLLHTNFLVDPIIIIGRTKDIKVVMATFVSVCVKRHRCCRYSDLMLLRRGSERTMISLTSRGVVDV